MKLFPGRDRGTNRPVLPNRESVFFPGVTLPVVVSHSLGRGAVQQAMETDRRVVVVNLLQEDKEVDAGNLHTCGTVCHILQLMKMPDGSLRILLEGQERVLVDDVTPTDTLLHGNVRPVETDRTDNGSELPQLTRLLQATFKEYAALSGSVTSETQRKIAAAESADRLVDLVAGHAALPAAARVPLLQEPSTLTRTQRIVELLASEVELLKLKRSLRDRVRKRMEKNQREIFLNEQIRELNRELGHDEPEEDILRDIQKRTEELQLPEQVHQQIAKETSRLKRLPPVSPESGIIRTYLDWLMELPWTERDEPDQPLPDLANAARILDEDHYDMQEPKDRLLEYIAVHTLNSEMKSPILCFVGPPGTGKTSLGKSMARALGRQFVRLSLGGVRDEAEIRGHRRTYVGAMPGRIIQAMKRAGTANPVILLDEIDKIGNDYRGDPSSALLEVLDPEQNSAFSDHYIELPFNLSRVTFLTTANSLHSIPAPLRDRLEVIEIPGYTEMEKRHIARQFLIPEQLRENGLAAGKITVREDALKALINEYTGESGVRSLKRQIASVVRKLARETLEQNREPQQYQRTVSAATVRKLLGPPRYRHDLVDVTDTPPGLVRGLAWTENGGVVLSVEAALLDTKGDLILTGSLGEVMKESARTALSVLLSNRDTTGWARRRQDKTIHVHVPQGAIPKDGPSAGITLYAALLSALAATPVPSDLAMTGEITLTGRVLAVGGIKEKVLAAQRRGISRVIIPADNAVDLEILPRECTKGISFTLIEHVRELIPMAFPDLGSPEPAEEDQ